MATEEPSAGARGDLGQAWGNPSAHRQVDSSSVMKREKHASLGCIFKNIFQDEVSLFCSFYFVVIPGDFGEWLGLAVCRDCLGES